MQRLEKVEGETKIIRFMSAVLVAIGFSSFVVQQEHGVAPLSMQAGVNIDADDETGRQDGSAIDRPQLAFAAIAATRTTCGRDITIMLSFPGTPPRCGGQEYYESRQTVLSGTCSLHDLLLATFLCLSLRRLESG